VGFARGLKEFADLVDLVESLESLKDSLGSCLMFVKLKQTLVSINQPSRKGRRF
jgi:hypothetical protein